MDGASTVTRAGLTGVVLFLLLSACDQDPFRRREKPILNGFSLQQWEDSASYYLVRDADTNDSGGGVLEGVVKRIAWNERYILADREANFGGDRNGWMIVDTATGKITGPFTDAELNDHHEVTRLRVMDAAEAWHAKR
jgi:hypothetical protein